MVFEDRLNCLFAPGSHNYHMLGHNLKYLFYEMGAVLSVCLPFSLKVYGPVVIFGWYKYPDPGPAVFINFLFKVADSKWSSYDKVSY